MFFRLIDNFRQIQIRLIDLVDCRDSLMQNLKDATNKHDGINKHISYAKSKLLSLKLEERRLLKYSILDNDLMVSIVFYFLVNYLLHYVF